MPPKCARPGCEKPTPRKQGGGWFKCCSPFCALEMGEDIPLGVTVPRPSPGTAKSSSRKSSLASGIPVFEVIEPDQSESKSACFIATAACGTEQADDVIRLRHFRDTVLRRTSIGRGFIHAYEYLSPPVARAIAGYSWARRIVRIMIVIPARYFADFWTSDK